MTKHELLREIEAFLRDQNMAPSRFGRAVMNDSKFVYRLRDQGSDVKTGTVEKVNAFIKAERKKVTSHG